jgi:hypothetical protein
VAAGCDCVVCGEGGPQAPAGQMGLWVALNARASALQTSACATGRRGAAHAARLLLSPLVAQA